MFLLDTMVISENFKRQPNAGVAAWFRSHEMASMFLSTLTFGEIAAGVEKQRQFNVAAFGRLSVWLVETRDAYSDRTLGVSTDVAIRWGMLYARLNRRDTDLIIAATALEHDLTVVTRNIRHFEPTGAKVFNPYE